MLTSNADVFRARQVVCDLIDSVRQHRDAIARLGPTGAETEALTSIIDRNCKLDGPDPSRSYGLLLLAAALPEEDFSAFTAATALLVANRIQGGVGDDDLYWNWDAFRDHYRLADAPVRAALMNGFRFMHDFGFATLSNPPEPTDCLTSAKADVIESLTAGDYDNMLSAVSNDAPADEAGLLWEAEPVQTLTWQALLGYRFLYERPTSLSPRHPGTCRLIPWA